MAHRKPYKTRRKKAKSCDGKQPYPDIGHALGAIKRLNKKHFIFHQLHPYYCKYCGKWHIGRTKTILYDKFKKLTKISM
jgi:hypothetical protein